MRVAVCLFALALAGCAQSTRYTSACDVSDPQRAIGSQVTFKAMLMRGGDEYPPMVVDPRCWRGFPADLRAAPSLLREAFGTPGRFNKFALISGRLVLFNKRPWLHVTGAQQIRVDPPMSEAKEQAFAERMMRERKAWRRPTPSAQPAP